MKLSTIFSLIVTFGFVGLSSTTLREDPVWSVLKIKYNLPLLDWESSCNEAYKEIIELQEQSINLVLGPLLDSIQKKLPNPKSTEGLDDLIKKDCEDNRVVKNLSGNVMSNVKKCSEVDKDQEDEMENELIKAICSDVRTGVEWLMQFDIDPVKIAEEEN